MKRFYDGIRLDVSRRSRVRPERLRPTRASTAALTGVLLFSNLLVAAGPGMAPEVPRAGFASAADTLPSRIAPERLLEALEALAHDSMQGRRAGTVGGERARLLLRTAFEERGLAPVDGRWTHEFEIRSASGSGDPGGDRGVNLLGMVEGTRYPERFVVVSAHYDHLGTRNGEIYNGADDNASGAAALLSLGEYLSRERPRHSFLFVAFDAEEMGLLGARAFVEDPPVPLQRILMNVNLDMVSRSEANELYVAGTHHSPFLVPLIEEVARGADIDLLRGHDTPELPPGDDWTLASDHAPFHEVEIPFAYFGVEDHPGYHRPSDTFDNVTPEFYVNAVETVLDFLLIVDREGEEMLP